MKTKPGFIIYTCSIIGFCSFSIFMSFLSIFSPKINTADFRGIVQEIEIDNENEVAFISAYGLWREDSKVFIDASYNIPCTNIYGQGLSVNNIKAGDMIDFSYKGDWGLEDGVFKGTAKWLTVYPKPD